MRTTRARRPTQELLGDNPSSGNNDPAVPNLSIANRPVDQWIVPNPNVPLTFHTHDVGLTVDLELVPLMSRRAEGMWFIGTFPGSESFTARCFLRRPKTIVTRTGIW